MTYGAAFLFQGESAFSVIDELHPGAHVAVFGGVEEALDARRAGLHLRDTLLALLPGPSAAPVLLFRKPLERDTVVDQTLATSTGGINVEGCRVSTGEARTINNYASVGAQGCMNRPVESTHADETYQTRITMLGRWPANVVVVHASGCTPALARVKGHKGYPNGPGGSSTQFSQKGTKTTRTRAWEGYAEADGMETVNDWACVSGCPRVSLDALSGELRARGNLTPTKRRQSEGVTGWGVGPDGDTYPGDAGGASRFFPQFADFEALCAWFAKLLVPPGTVLFRLPR